MPKGQSPLKFIESLHPSELTLLAASADPDQQVQVRSAGGYRWMTNGGNSVQSLQSVITPDDLLLPNHVAMLMALQLVRQPGNILCLGTGGACIERYLSRTFDKSRITSVEADAGIIAFAKRYFGIPATVDIVHACAETFLAQETARYDLVLCDIFTNEVHPACLYEADFHQHLSDTLAPAGAVALNLSPSCNNELLSILKLIRAAFTSIHIARVPDHANVVVIASKQTSVPLSRQSWQGPVITGQSGPAPDALLQAFHSVPNTP